MLISFTKYLPVSALISITIKCVKTLENYDCCMGKKLACTSLATDFQNN